MKRVGIITLYYKTYNYGAQLQAYALQNVIENLGYECEQIRFVWSKEDTIYGYENAAIDLEGFCQFADKIKHSEKVYDADTISECVEDYDVFVTGSDQVWGVENSMPVYKLPIMTLSFVPEYKVKFSYAASLGSSTASEKIEEVLKKELPKLDAVSVRENSAADYLSEVCHIPVETVLDPVFLLDKKYLDDMADTNGKTNGEYVLYYSAGVNERERELMACLYKRFRIPVKKLGYVEGERTSPEGFVRLIRDAKYIVTDSFHASVLSLIYHKQFVTLPIDAVPTGRSRNARAFDLLRSLELSDRFIIPDSDFEAYSERIILKLTDVISYCDVDAKLKELRECSRKFLSDSLATDKDSDCFLKKKEDCSGCGVCTLVCRRNAIRMKKDAYGFQYPVRNRKQCIECGNCRDVCNDTCRTNSGAKLMALQTKNTEVRKKSSSGGVFYEMANRFIEDGGIVVACRFDDKFNVVHDFCTTKDEIDFFCRSKYVQSDAYKTFEKIREYLESDVGVLFVGTPCQTYALRAYLKKSYLRLYMIDLVCGGVGAPGLWEKYLQGLSEKGTVMNLSMRHKYAGYLGTEGFPAFSMKIEYEGNEETFSGLNDYYLSSRLSFYQDSCYRCKWKGLQRVSDITIGDMCGMSEIMSEKYDGLGTTLSLVHSAKGEELIEKCKDAFEFIEINEETSGEILRRNPMISNQMKYKPQHFYLRSVFENSTVERIFYENKFWDEFCAKENLLKEFHKEIKRNELLLKVERYGSMGLWIDEDPCVKGEIFIYGAGKLGRNLISCVKNVNNVKGYIDGNPSIKSCLGIPVWHLADSEMSKLLSKKDTATVIVTPVWDFENIKENLQKVFCNVNVISLKEVVGNIWI